MDLRLRASRPALSTYISAGQVNSQDIGGDYHDHSTTNIKYVHDGSTRGDPLERLERMVSRGAAHDSSERGSDAPKCHPETRKAVQGEIMTWIEHGDNDPVPTKILWLSGPAGAGKTAIAGSIAEECQGRGWLAGSFFFSAYSMSPDRQSKTHLIPTLAYHFLHQNTIHGLKESILSSIANTPSIFDRRLRRQLEVLILGPLRRVKAGEHQSLWPKVIIIDGLDECDGGGVDERFQTEQDRQRSRTESHREILDALVRASTDPSFPFRIIVASRPEPAIERFFSAVTMQAFRHVFLDDKYSPESDIELFLRAALTSIGREYNLPDDWYSSISPRGSFPQGIPQYLAEQASGQFVYASVVIRFVQNTTRPPQEQLKTILQWRRVHSRSNPFASLDELYTGILNTSPDPLRAAKWLRSIHILVPTSNTEDQVPFPRGSGDWYAKAVLESYPGETEYLLSSLTSLIGFRAVDGAPSFKFYHKSLLDYLDTVSRSGDLHVSAASAKEFLSDRHFQVLKSRSPQGTLNETNYGATAFIREFCWRLVHWLDLDRPYLDSDIDWWTHNLYDRCRETGVNRKGARLRNVFSLVHRECHWSRCLPSCKIWRKGILRYCKAQSWAVPTRMKLFLDKFRKFNYADPHVRMMGPSPL